jgi:putative holliday junction resolvase
MNSLGIDYGTKRIGLAISINGIISPLDVLSNDKNIFEKIKKIIDDFKIEKIYVGLCEGEFAIRTKEFVSKLSSMLQLSVETIEESVSTIEADQIFKTNKKKNKDYKNKIDSIAAAVILRRSQG